MMKSLMTSLTADAAVEMTSLMRMKTASTVSAPGGRQKTGSVVDGWMKL